MAQNIVTTFLPSAHVSKLTLKFSLAFHFCELLNIIFSELSSKHIFSAADVRPQNSFYAIEKGRQQKKKKKNPHL